MQLHPTIIIIGHLYSMLVFKSNSIAKVEKEIGDDDMKSESNCD